MIPLVAWRGSRHWGELVVTAEAGAVISGAVVRLRGGGEMVGGEVVGGEVVGGEVVGGGFLVGPGLVATCAHVVADALGADPYSPGAPDGPVRLDFPLTPDGADPPVLLDAVVQQWSPIADDGTGDMALLRLTGPPPPHARVPPLRRVDRLWDHGFRVFGFPTDRPDGVWSSGLIRGEQSTRWFQLQSTSGEQRIEGGFSGSPVWDVQSGAVVGMTVAADRGDTTTAYIIPIDQVLGLDPALLPCPYRGLRPFEEEHAGTFFGREAEIDKLVDAVGRMAVVAVAGPSGAGKSSLVRAGLLPRLRAAGTPVVDVRAQPGADLAADLATELGALPAPGSVVVIDQFEELAAVDPAGARRALEQVVRLTGTEPVRAVLTVRWAALDQVVTPELMGALEKGTVLVAPMSRGRLREAILGPAERSPGLAFEPGLVDRILDDAGAEPGQLPLVESLLTDLWERREGGYLTLRAYMAAGGVAGAVAERAERAIGALGPDAIENLRRLFTALARPDRDGRLVRQAVPLAQLPAEQRALLPALADGRLLVVGRAGAADAMVVEPAHQALIDHWPRLRTWLDADRAFLSWRDRVDGQRARWEAEDRADAALLRGAPLAEAAEWLPARARDVGPASQAYLDRSRARQRWEVRRWRVVAAVLAVLGLAAAALSVVAVERRQVLAGQLATATAGTLARESQSRAPADIALGARLALAAWRSDRGHPQARSALAASYLALQSADAELVNVAPATVTRLEAAGDTAIAVGPPHPVAVTGTDGQAARSEELPGTEPAPQLALSPDGRQLADVAPDRTAVRVRDLATPAELRALPDSGRQVGAPRFAPEGTRLMWLSADAAGAVTMRVWDLRSDSEVPNRLGVLAPDTLAVWLTPDPDLVLVRTGAASAATAETRLALRSLTDGAEVAVMPPSSGVVLGGAAVASCAQAGTDPAVVTVTPVGAAIAPLQVRTLGGSCRIGISADGGTLIEPDPAGAPATALARITDLRSGAAHELDLPLGVLADSPAQGFIVETAVAVAGTPDRPVLLAAHHGSVLRMTTRPVLPDEVAGQGAVRTASDDGRYIMTRGGDTLLVEDPNTGERLAALPGVVGEGSRVAFGSEIWVFDPEPDGWTVTRYDVPTLRRTASFRLPVSADPLPTSSELLAGQDVGLTDIETPAGRRLLSISDGLLAVLDPQTGQPLHPPTTLGGSPEERRWFQRAPLLAARPGHPDQAVVTGMDGGLQVWDTERGEHLRTIPTAYRPLEEVRAPRFAIDRAGSRLAVLTPNGTIEVWDLDTGAPLGPAVPAPGVTDLLGFDADGYLVAEGDLAAGAELRFIDLDERREAGSMSLPHGIDGMVGDGKAVRVNGFDGSPPALVPLIAAAWRDQLCSVIRPFTAPEQSVLPPGAGTEEPCS
jgi:WD40 repeat protein